MTDPKAVVNRSFELFQRRDAEGFMALVADDAVFRGPARPEIRGKEAISGMIHNQTSAFSEFRSELRRQFVDGEFVITETTDTQTHNGDLTLATGETVGATGRVVTNDCVYIDRVVDGKIVDSRMYFDRHAFLEQIGQVPKAAAAAS